MSKLFSLIAPIILSAVILPHTMFAVGEWRTAHSTQLILTETVQLFDKNDSSTGLSASVAPQTVNVVSAWSYTPGWYQIETWLGQKWIYASNAIEHEPDYGTKKLQLNDTFYLYDQPFDKNKTGYAVSPQAVESVDVSNGFYKIKTWLGDKWIKTPSFDNRYAITDLSSNDQLVKQSITLTKETPVYESPSTNSKVLGAFAAQTVQSYESFNGNWYHIHTTWVGDAWIKVDNVGNK